MRERDKKNFEELKKISKKSVKNVTHSAAKHNL